MMKHCCTVVLFFILLISLAGCAPAATPAVGSLRDVTRTPFTIEPLTPMIETAPSRTPSPTPTLTPKPAEQRPLLMAHYMPWYQSKPVSGAWGWHWSMNHFDPDKKDARGRLQIASHFTPLTGPYDSSDPDLLEYQVLLMKLSGIDGVIVDWYGTEDFWDYATLNRSTMKLFEVIQKAGLKFAICYEDQTVLHMIENKHIAEKDAIAQGQKEMAFLQKNWFSDDAYLKTGGRPVLFNFGRAYFKDEASWKALFDGLPAEPLLVMEDNPLGQTAPSSYPWPPMHLSQDGILTPGSLQGYLDAFYQGASGQPYRVAGAFPGFKDIYSEAGVRPSYGFLDALDGQTFRSTLQRALSEKPDVVQLVTWNDYGEGTNIEPTQEYGTRYLEMLQEARRAQIDPLFNFTAGDLSLPLRLYQARKQYAGNTAAQAELDKVFAAILKGDMNAAQKILEKYP